MRPNKEAEHLVHKYQWLRRVVAVLLSVKMKKSSLCLHPFAVVLIGMNDVALAVFSSIECLGLHLHAVTVALFGMNVSALAACSSIEPVPDFFPLCLLM